MHCHPRHLLLGWWAIIWLSIACTFNIHHHIYHGVFAVSSRPIDHYVGPPIGRTSAIHLCKISWMRGQDRCNRTPQLMSNWAHYITSLLMKSKGGRVTCATISLILRLMESYISKFIGWRHSPQPMNDHVEFWDKDDDIPYFDANVYLEVSSPWWQMMLSYLW